MGIEVLSIGTVVAVVSAVASLIAIVVSLRTAREQRELARHLAEEEHLLLFEQVRMQRDSDVLRWTKECVSVLSACEAFVDFFAMQARGSGYQERYEDLCVRLSALIDEGRLYFPNESPDGKGQTKPPAYRGERQLILTVLVRAYDQFKSATDWEDPQKRKALVKSFNDLRRIYVSEAQIAIDPRRYIALKEMNELKRNRGLDAQPADQEASFKKYM